MAPGCGSARLTSRDALAAALLDEQPLPAEVMEQVLSGLRAWLQAGSYPLPLPAYIGLPSTPARARLAARNHYLCQAAQHLPGNTLWHRARALHAEVDHFERRLWHAWSTKSAAPCYATEVQTALWHARRWSPTKPLPDSAEGLLAVLTKHFPETP